MSSGYGRGGRGAALLKALQEPPRKPGETTEPAVKPPMVGKPIGLGRGALLAQLASQASKPAAPTPTPGVAAAPAPLPLGRGFGRGIAASAGTPAPTPPLAMGRSSLLAMAPAFGRGVKKTPLAEPVLAQPAAARPAAPAQPTVPAQQAAQPRGDGPEPSQRDTQRQRRSMIDRMMDDMTISDKEKQRGTSGQAVSVVANYIRLRTANNDGVYLYRVEFKPALDNLAIRRRLLREVPDLPRPFEFDGANMFTPTKLADMVVSASSREGTKYDIDLKLVRVLPYATLTQFFNIMFHRIMLELKMAPVRRMYYDAHTPQYIPQHKLEVWPGYVTSIKEYDGGLMCLLDTTHKVLRTDTVYSVMADIGQRQRGDFRDAVARAVVGAIVLTRYNNKTYRVDDIDWEQTPKSTFETRNGPVSYSSYYKEHHGKTISDMEQPLLIHRPTKREQRESRGQALEVICLVPELCYLTGLTDECRQDFRVMKDLATHTRISPGQRQERLRQFTENVNSHAATRKILSDWGLTLDSEAITIQGRKMPIETILLGNGRSVSAGDKAEWSSAFNRNAVREAVDLNNWMVLCTKSNERDVGAFLNHIKTIYPQLGARIANPKFITLTNDRTESYLQEIKKNLHDEVQLVMTVFPSSRDDRYNAVKKLCYCEMPVASQVINHRTIKNQQKTRSVAQKVALQMNAKLGGGLWAVNIPVDGLMIVGIDVYHDSPRGSCSWGGFVATLNQGCTRWYSKVCKQLPGQELTDGLKVCLVSALKEYYKLNHSPPRRIVIFRDGVGDGDLPNVRNFEVPQLQAAFPLYGEGYQPQLAMVVVQKRINTKLYQCLGNPRNPRYDNPAPGTVVDHTVTRKELEDFFLVSQFVRQGTVTPTHYVVVHNTTDFNLDKIQRLAYKMTHMYYNWPGTIRSPAPCQYAHKVAYMAGQNLRRDPSALLATRLFYL